MATRGDESPAVKDSKHSLEYRKLKAATKAPTDIITIIDDDITPERPAASTTPSKMTPAASTSSDPDYDFKKESITEALQKVQIPCDESEFAEEEDDMPSGVAEAPVAGPSRQPGSSVSDRESTSGNVHGEGSGDAVMADDDEMEEEYEYDDEEEEEEIVEQDDDGIPVSAIAKLSPDELVRLGQLKTLHKALNGQIEKLRTHTTDNDEEDQVVQAKLTECYQNSEKTINAICKLCKLDDDEEAEELPTQVKPFRFRNSGNKYLDRVLTELVKTSLARDAKPDQAGQSSRKSAGSLGITNFDDLTEKKVSLIMTAVAKKENEGQPGTRLIHRKTRRPIVAAEVFESLHHAMQRHRSRLFNNKFVPKYTEMEDRNPRLPEEDDDGLRTQLVANENGGKLLEEAVRGFAEFYEVEATKLNLPVARDANDEDVVEPDFGNDDTDEEEENEENCDADGPAVEPIPVSTTASSTEAAAGPSTSAGVEDMDVDEDAFNADDLVAGLV